ncbi:hypothetical protein LBWT_X3970 (plasmid) [Leptolyngbya boryana IAM M-101]|nr:hypothetical protein LBWT_X3970 [Leptolyngbya boryana IAM M-101]BAS66673.1 hypothetical protein LBDG_X3970 [Leptolyngbya boryana dg5]
MSIAFTRSIYGAFGKDYSRNLRVFDNEPINFFMLSKQRPQMLRFR